MEKGNRERHFVNIDEKMGSFKKKIFNHLKKERENSKPNSSAADK